MEGKYSHRSVKTSRNKPYRYYVEQTAADESGIPRKKTLLSKSFHSQAEGKEWADECVYELKNGKSAKSVQRRGAGRTIGDLCEHYLRTAGDYDAEKDKYSGGLHETAQHKRYVNWWTGQLGHKSLADVDQFEIKDALRTYLSEPCTHYCRKTKTAVPHKRKRKTSSRNRLHAALRRVYNFAQGENWVAGDVISPAHQVKMPKEGNERKRGLDVEQVKALLQACKNSHWDRMHLFISGLATTGARKNEWLQMDWRRINLAGQYAFVPHTKNGESKTLALTDDVMAELLEIRLRLYLESIGAGDGSASLGVEPPADWIPEGLLFPSPVKPQQAIDIRKAWTNAKAAIGMTAKMDDPEEIGSNGLPVIRYLRLHDLRHTVGALLHAQGKSQFEIRDHLGHKKLQSTERYVGKSQSGIVATTNELGESYSNG